MTPFRLLIALASVLSSLASMSCAGNEERASGPNVLLIVVDTLRADRLGAYGFDRPTSPNLDRLAARGVRMERFYTAAPTTLASFTTLLTGRYPHSHGVYRNGVARPEGAPDLASVFRAAGYRTAGFVASYCLSEIFGVDRGFEHFDDELTVATPEMPSNKLIRRGAEVTDSVLAWLRTLDRDAPFFAMVHYFDPHWPYSAPEPFRTMFDPDYDGPVRGSFADVLAMRARLREQRGRPDRDTDHLHALHLGEIRYTDHEIGRLLEGLEARGLGLDTLVVVTADHGEGIYEHGDFFDHGMTVYDSNIRIPLIVAGPRIEGGGRVVGGPASNVDLAPTLLDYAGLDVPEDFEGRSFAAVLTGVGEIPGPDRDLFAEATKPRQAEAGQAWPNRLKDRCVIRGRLKLIRRPLLGDGAELYDLVADPGEIRDLAGGPEAANGERMDASLRAWSEVVPETLPPRPETDPDVLERLRSLGYVR
jgi:arylsulfatase A-like enzyme